MSTKFNEAQSLLQRSKLRLTLSRVATMAVLLDADQPLSVDAVYNALVVAGQGLSRASVYRSLGEFERAGIAIQGWEHVESGRMVYARAPAQAPSGDFELVCTSCSRIVHVQDKLLAQQLYYHALHGAFERRLAELRIQIVCNGCAA